MRRLILWFLRLGADRAGEEAWGWIFAKSVAGSGVITALCATIAAVLRWPITVRDGVALFVVSAALLVVTLVVAKRRPGGVTPTSARTGANAIPPGGSPTRRQYVEATPEYLCGLFKAHTSLQAERLVEPFIGKWMVVSGTLGDAMPFGEFVQVTFENSAPTYLFMYFQDKSKWDDIYVRARGTHMVVHGRIKEIGAVSLHLERCEIH